MNPKEKLKQLAGGLSPLAYEALEDVLDGVVLTRQDSYFDIKAPEYMQWLEARLAAPHLKYLAKDQVNGIWGQSTTEALHRVADTYKIKRSDDLNSDLLIAILDGQKSYQPVESKAANSYEWLKALVKKQDPKNQWTEKIGCINIVGIRGYIVPRGQVENAPNLYNDTIFIAGIDKNGSQFVESYLASTDPGRYYYAQKRLNPAGCAYLPPGQYTYQKGRHVTSVSNYPALNPINGGWIRVYRIGSSGKPTDKKLHWGQWINIHAGTSGYSVENASAGCQVIHSNGSNGWEWIKFWSRVNRARNQIFHYTLIEL